MDLFGCQLFGPAFMKTATVYPNPFYDQIKIDLPYSINANKVEGILFDLLGREIEGISISKGSSNIYFSGLKELPKGVYLLRLHIDDKLATFKLVH